MESYAAISQVAATGSLGALMGIVSSMVYIETREFAYILNRVRWPVGYRVYREWTDSGVGWIKDYSKSNVGEVPLIRDISCYKKLILQRYRDPLCPCNGCNEYLSYYIRTKMFYPR